MRVLRLINIVYIYINRMYTTHGETRGEIKFLHKKNLLHGLYKHHIQYKLYI